MAPAYDEFEEKDKRRRSSSDAIIALRPRIRRNRRTCVCIIAVIVLALYYLLKASTHIHNWESPLDPLDDEDEFAPYYQYHPVLGAADSREAKTELPKVRFPHLYSSLSASSAAGLRTWNQNVLFFAVDLKAAKRLAVTACEMSKHDRTQVHLALMGDSSAIADDFQTYSGIGPDGDCKVTFHDATTMTQLTLPLLGKAVKYALIHLHRFLHPQVMFVDTENENQVVSKTTKDTANQLGIPLIELPRTAADNLRWMTRLSSQSLRAWNRPKVEIFIRCDKNHGNLERLLKSLRNADYFGIMPTRLTIEVGTNSPLHPFTQEFIENFNWPSRDRIGIRYPLSPPGEDSFSQAVNHIQSFYPADSDTSILFLDPNVEVSPYYFHWLHYTTLEYIYSDYPFNADPDELYGISLTTPKAYINGKEPFNPGLTEPGPYLYGAPSMEAALIFPQPWKKFFAYFQWRMKGIITQKSSPSPTTNSSGRSKKRPKKSMLPEDGENNSDLLLGTTEKDGDDKLPTGTTNLNQRAVEPSASPPPSPVVERNFTLPNMSPSSEFSSSWQIYLAEFAQVQGNLMLYPNFGLTDEADALAICHSESPSKANYKMGSKNPGQHEQRLIQSMALLDSLPGWNLPIWLRLPIRSIAGENLAGTELKLEAYLYRQQISHGCPDEQTQELKPVEDLLCTGMA